MMHAPSPALHIHLDAVGGIAGDMFLAALLAYRPDLLPAAVAAARAVGVPDDWTVELAEHRADGFVGKRLLVEPPHRHHHHHEDHGHHHHVRHRDIVRRIDDAALEPGVKSRAKAIFALLADAEARVHGVDVAEVSFHEVADWDSVADIVGAAAVIEALGSAVTWTLSSLPLGGGSIQTAHGRLPVPAPATALLLEGFVTHDDGITGERVTPTGAAILAHLRPEQGRRPAGRLIASGAGFGTRRLPGLPNMLRVLVLAPAEAATTGTTAAEVTILAFEVDDQTAEDLAVGLERVRAQPGVLDVLQYPALGKKNRMLASVRVLCESDAADRVAEVCLTETTTLGVRMQTVTRRVVERQHGSARTSGGAVRVKTAERPDGRRTAKAEMDDLAGLSGGRRQRAAARAEAEEKVLRDKGRKGT